MTLKTPTTAGNSGAGAKTSSSDNESSSPNRSRSSKANVGAIAGGTIAGVVAVALGILGIMMFRHRLQRRESQRPPVYEGRVPLPVEESPAEGVYAGHGDGERTIQP